MTEVIWIIIAVVLSTLCLAIGVRCSTLADRSRVKRFTEKRFGALITLAPCQETSAHEHATRFSSYWIAECVDDEDRHHRVRCRCGFWQCEMLEHQPLS